MKRNWLEWAILVISVAVVVALVGYLLVTGLASGGPAIIRAAVSSAEAADGSDGGWLVPLTLRNEGGKAAVSIVVEGTATVAGMEESSELTVDVLAADSEVELVRVQRPAGGRGPAPGRGLRDALKPCAAARAS